MGVKRSVNWHVFQGVKPVLGMRKKPKRLGGIIFQWLVSR